MILYFSIGVFLFLLAFLRATGAIESRYEVTLALCVTLLAYLISFLRWQTGTDWESYFLMYQQLTSIEMAHDLGWWGPGYSYLAVLLNSWGASYSAFLLCIATILFGTKFYLLQKTTTAPLIAVFLLYCVNFYDIFFVRQNVATVFFWAFAYFYYKRNFVPAFGAALVAVLFHYSAILPIGVVIALSNLSWKRVLLFGGLSLAAVAFIATHLTFEDLARMSGFGGYLTGDYVEEKASTLSTTLRSYLKLTFWFLIIAFGYRYFLHDRRSDEEPGWAAFCLKNAAGIVAAAAVLVPLSEIFARIPEYAMPFFAVVLSGYRFQLRGISVASTIYIAALLLLFVQLGFIFSAYANLYYPLKTILN